MNDSAAMTKKALDFEECYNALTPENQAKARAKINEFIVAQKEMKEQAAREAAGAPKIFYYFFECLDDVIGYKYLTAADINKALTGAGDPMQESDIIELAHKHKATLRRYSLDAEGGTTNETVLHIAADNAKASAQKAQEV